MLAFEVGFSVCYFYFSIIAAFIIAIASLSVYLGG